MNWFENRVIFGFNRIWVLAFQAKLSFERTFWKPFAENLVVVGWWLVMGISINWIDSRFALFLGSIEYEFWYFKRNAQIWTMGWWSSSSFCKFKYKSMLTMVFHQKFKVWSSIENGYVAFKSGSYVAVICEILSCPDTEHSSLLTFNLNLENLLDLYSL